MAGIVIPALGFATDEVIVVNWHKSVGESVSQGDALLDLEAEKSISSIEASESGILLAAYAQVGAIIAEGATVGWIGKAGETPPQADIEYRGWAEELAPIPEALASSIPSAGLTAQRSGGDEGARTAKKGRAKLREFLKGSLRRITAQRMARSWVQAPKVDLFADIDFSRVVAHRQALKADGHQAPSYNIYIAHAVVKAFEDMPHLNLNFVHGREVRLDDIAVGVAVALDDALLTISMKQLDGASLEDIQHRFKGLIRKSIGMTLTREEMYGNSLTITNLGEFEVSSFTAIINPPEIFILAIGQLDERVVSREGAFVAIPTSRFCLSFDHRGVDGAPASKLLRRIKYHMEHYGIEN